MVALSITCSNSEEVSPLISLYRFEESFEDASVMDDNPESVVDLMVAGSGIEFRKVSSDFAKALGCGLTLDLYVVILLLDLVDGLP
jgi:hypothetical protein